MLTVVLAFIGFCNLLLNLTILVVLRVSQGMEALEVIPEQDLVKFYGNTDLDRVSFKRSNKPRNLTNQAHINFSNGEVTKLSKRASGQ